MLELTSNLIALAKEIHADNIRMGWWKLDEAGNTIPRNIGELLCLVHSEISEAAHGIHNGLMDDKLTHRRMFEVELADVDIRVLDILGYYISIGVEIYFDSPLFSAASVDGYLLEMHKYVSGAMEYFRKGKLDAGCAELVMLTSYLDYVAFDLQLDLPGAVVEKRAFNATRADHKPENRAKEGGKAF